MCVSELAHKYDRNEVSIYIPPRAFISKKTGISSWWRLTHVHIYTHTLSSPLRSHWPLKSLFLFAQQIVSLIVDQPSPLLVPSETKFQQTRHYFPLDDLADKRNREYFSSELHGPRFAETSRSGGTRHRLGIINEVTRIIAIVIRYIGTCYTQEAV